MRPMIKSRKIIYLSVILLISSFFIPISLPQNVDQTYKQYTMIEEGQILYAPMYQTTTYLRDYTGTINHTWPSGYVPGCMVRWLDEETIIRTIRVGVGPGAGGAGGGVPEREPASGADGSGGRGRGCMPRPARTAHSVTPQARMVGTTRPGDAGRFPLPDGAYTW